MGPPPWMPGCLLVPVRPADDLVELVNADGCAVVWEDGKTFERQDPS